jgi:predicted enzyme related to lactoylglutathione lyase
MSERSTYTPGTPSWVELSGTPDIEASEAFYRELFGWEMPEQPSSAELGGYRRAKLNGKDVAGVSPAMEDGQPIAWATYVSVEDAAASAETIRAKGGSAMVEPMAVQDLGTMAVFTDPGGAVFGLWQPGSFAGAELANEPGAFAWNELGTRDTAGAKEFYAAVFGWSYDDMDSPRVGTYTAWKLGEAMVGGMLDIDAAGLPAEIPAHWLVYFGVEDIEAALEKAKAGGGAVRMEPIEIPGARFAILADQFGAVFGVMQPIQGSEAGR